MNRRAPSRRLLSLLLALSLLASASPGLLIRSASAAFLEPRPQLTEEETESGEKLEQDWRTRQRSWLDWLLAFLRSDESIVFHGEHRLAWKKMFADLPFTGIWGADLLLVAETQIGYTESETDHIFKDGEYRGYTRYGDWYGLRYEDWCAMFVAFCLEYAGIPEELFPRDSGCMSWIEKLKEKGYFAKPGEVTPKPGDLVFFDRDLDGICTHVGIFRCSYLDPDGNPVIETIEGNSNNQVRVLYYRPDEKAIYGYGVLPLSAEDIPKTGEATEGEIPAAQEMEENENG